MRRLCAVARSSRLDARNQTLKATRLSHIVYERDNRTLQQVGIDQGQVFPVLRRIAWSRSIVCIGMGDAVGTKVGISVPVGGGVGVGLGVGVSKGASTTTAWSWSWQAARASTRLSVTSAARGGILHNHSCILQWPGRSAGC